MKSIFTLTLLITLSLTAFTQKLKSDGFEATIKSLKKHETESYGELRETYIGVVKVKLKDSKKVKYKFHFLNISGVTSQLSIRDSHDQILEPRLYYDEKNKSFGYHLGTGKAFHDKVLSDKSIEDIILSGVLIWLKNKKYSGQGIFLGHLEF